MSNAQGRAQGRASSTLFTLFFLPLLALTIFALAFGAIFLLGVPHRAAERFGPPSPLLDQRQVYWLSMRLLLQEKDLLTPTDPAGGIQEFSVDLGESTLSVLQRLQGQGLIRSAGALSTYLQYTGLDTTMQAGQYTLSPTQSPVEIALAMQDATPGQVTVTILPGWRLEEVAAALPYTGLQISPEALIAAAAMPPQGYTFSESMPLYATAEGFLYPDTYEVDRETSAPMLLGMFLARFDSQVSAELRQGFADQGLSLYEAVTLASLIEREAIVEDEMPKIASVFHNRLAAGMNLASDPTVQFAVGYNETQKTWWTNPLSAADLSFDSLYNTYLYPGLPPGPIANPGLPALQAAAFPEDTPYYYFRALCDGSQRHAFAITYEEHIQNACK